MCERVDALLEAEVATCDPVRMEVLAGARDERHLDELRRLLARGTSIPTLPTDYEDAARGTARVVATATRFAGSSTASSPRWRSGRTSSCSTPTPTSKRSLGTHRCDSLTRVIGRAGVRRGPEPGGGFLVAVPRAAAAGGRRGRAEGARRVAAHGEGVLPPRPRVARRSRHRRAGAGARLPSARRGRRPRARSGPGEPFAVRVHEGPRP